MDHDLAAGTGGARCTDGHDRARRNGGSSEGFIAAMARLPGVRLGSASTRSGEHRVEFAERGGVEFDLRGSE